MAYEDSNMLNNSRVHSDKADKANNEKSVQQQLADAHQKIEDLKQEIAWLERSHE